MSVERAGSAHPAMPYAPPKGTRPDNRKELIRRSSAELFYQHGFAMVSMNQIARAVSIGPSALYRHFASKQELLAAVIEASVDEVNAALKETSRQGAGSIDWDDAFVTMALDTRSVGVLWQREARHLPAEERVKLATSLRQIRHQIRQSIQLNHPETEQRSGLITRAVLSICLSLSYHHVSLPRIEFEALLKQMVFSVLAVEYPANPLANGVDRQPRNVARKPSRTQEKLVVAASKLFAQHGFAQTSLVEIAAEVGISEPSIYHHFPSKLDLLFEVMQHGNDALQKGRAAALAVPGSPESLLRRLATSYLDIVAAEQAFITLLVTELGNLDEPRQVVIVAQQRAYLNQWFDLLLKIKPSMQRDEARIRVHAVLTVVNDHVTRSRGKLDAPSRTALIAICRGLLGL